MSIQFRNAAGAITVDANQKGTYFRDTFTATGITDKGYYQIKNSLGGAGDMGFMVNAPKLDDHLQWFRFNNNAKYMPMISSYMGGGLATQNAGVLARTHFNAPISGGYINVWNAAGQLIWSDQAAAKIPRIVGFLTIPPNFDLDNQVYQQNIGLDKWLLVSMCQGNISDDGMVTGYSGLFFRMLNGTLQVQWNSKLQKTWAQTFKATGLRIPFAIFPNL